MPDEKVILELWVEPEQFKRWKQVSDLFFMNEYEYIRKAVDAETFHVLRDIKPNLDASKD